LTTCRCRYVFQGNTFYGRGERLNRIQYAAATDNIYVSDNTWIDCPLLAGFQVGLLQLASSEPVSGLVANNSVLSPNVITEAFVAERGVGPYTIQYHSNFIGAGIKFFDLKQTPNSYLYGNVVVDANTFPIVGGLAQTPLSADPSNPAAGDSVMWVSDGTGSGDAGDVMLKINVAGVTKTITLVDFSAF
jgi:hypothetical protein